MEFDCELWQWRWEEERESEVAASSFPSISLSPSGRQRFVILSFIFEQQKTSAVISTLNYLFKKKNPL